MDSHSYRNGHDEKPFKNNMDSHSYRNMHDEKPYTKKEIIIRTEMSMTKTHSKVIWIVIRTEMCMTKTHTQRNG